MILKEVPDGKQEHFHRQSAGGFGLEGPSGTQRKERRAKHPVLSPAVRYRAEQSAPGLCEIRRAQSAAELYFERRSRFHSRRVVASRHSGRINRRRSQNETEVERGGPFDARRDADQLLLRSAGQDLGTRPRRKRMGGVRGAGG